MSHALHPFASKKGLIMRLPLPSTATRLPRRSPLGSGSVASLLATTLCAGLLSACGGGAGSDSVSSGGAPPIAAAQVAQGVVSGFGSVIVDGTAIDDSNASVRLETWDGQTVNGVLQLGQRVRVEHDAARKASRVTIDANVVGQVSAVDPVAGTLTVAGQPVRLNAMPGDLPMTRYGGRYTSAADIQAGDWVEVHGLPTFDVASASYRIQATRVQQLATESLVRVRGVITGLDGTARTFRFNGLTIAYGAALDAGRLLPAGASPANGAMATVFGNLVDPSQPLILTAKALRLAGSPGQELGRGTTAQLSGVVSGYRASPLGFTLDGLSVDAGSASIEPAGAAIGEGALVRVAGTINDTGVLMASRITVRGTEGSSELARIRLVGEVTDFGSAASFLIRGVPIDASAVDLSAGCAGQPIANGTMLRVEASQQTGTPVVKAVEAQCVPVPVIHIRPLRGPIASVNSATRALTLNDTKRGTVALAWNDNTTFVGLTAADLAAGLPVFVEAAEVNDTRIARLIRRDDRIARLDGDAFRSDAPDSLEAPQSVDTIAERTEELDEVKQPPLRRSFAEPPLEGLRKARERFRAERPRP